MSDTSLQQSTGEVAYKTPERLANPSQTLEQSLNKLGKYGGFEFLEAGIDGLASLNPERKARKNIFLTEEGKKRKELT